MKDFQTLQEKYGLEKQDFYRYLQLRHYFDQDIKKHIDLDDTVVKVVLLGACSILIKGLISTLYKALMSKKSHSVEYIKNKWEEEGNLLIPEEDWSNCCELPWKCTNSHTWREFGWKCLIRYFITPKQKTHISERSSSCWRKCGNQAANHWRIFWDCPVITQFWSEVHKKMESIFNFTISSVGLLLSGLNFYTFLFVCLTGLSLAYLRSYVFLTSHVHVT